MSSSDKSSDESTSAATSSEADVEEPITSPLTSPPVEPASETTSSGRPDDSSPICASPESSSLSSDEDSCPPVKRKRYEFYEPEVPYNPVYWPSEQHASSLIDLPEDSQVKDAHPDVPSEDADVTSPPVKSQQNPHFTATCSAEDADLSATSSVEGFPLVTSSGEGNLENNDSNAGASSQQDSCSSSSSSVLSSDKNDFSDNESTNTTPSVSESEESDDDSIQFGSVKVHEGSDITVDEAVYLLMDLFLSHNLKKVTLESMLKLVLKFLPEVNNIPQSKHSLFKYVQSVSPPVPVTIHFYCDTCHMYIGEQEKACPLPSCGGSSCSKFFQMSLGSQIRNMFENLKLAEILEKFADERKARQEDGLYFDLCDGSEFKRVQVPGQYNLTLLGHTDGISISKSSRAALWPIEFVISEVPPKLRFGFVIIAGIWVDYSKPTFHCYFKPCVDELNKLFFDGLTWVDPITHKEERTLVVAPSFCGDAPVRADIQNIQAHSGKNGCNCCEQKMVKLPTEPAVIPGAKDKKRKRVYFPQEVPSTLRTSQRMEAQARATKENFLKNGKFVPFKGVKGPSIFSQIPECDCSTAVYPEYMHSILGIVKQFIKMWFESDLPCNLKAHRDEINCWLKSVKMADFVTRSPDTVDDYTGWKANECRTFALYLSLIILAKFMSFQYLQHWMLFVSALYTLLQERVSENDIEKAEVMLQIFLKDFCKLYPLESLTYNLHNLSHYGLTTRRVGPLWSNSAFCFENFNGLLAKRIHGTKNQGIELVKTIQLHQGVQVLKARANTSDVKQRSVLFCSKIQVFRLSDVQKNLLVQSNLKSRDFYQRAIISGEVFTCNSYTRQREKNNYTVCFIDSSEVKRYGEINCFVECCDGKKMVFVSCFIIEHVRTFCHASSMIIQHVIPIKNSEEMQLIPLKNILFKVIRVDEYVCIRPNRYEINL